MDCDTATHVQPFQGLEHEVLVEGIQGHLLQRGGGQGKDGQARQCNCHLIAAES